MHCFINVELHKTYQANVEQIQLNIAYNNTALIKNLYRSSITKNLIIQTWSIYVVTPII